MKEDEITYRVDLVQRGVNKQFIGQGFTKDRATDIASRVVYGKHEAVRISASNNRDWEYFACGEKYDD